MNKPGRFVIAIILLVFMLICLGFGILLYFQGSYIPKINRIITVPFFERSPANTVRASARTTANLHAARYDLSVRLSRGENQNSLITEVPITCSGGLEEKITMQCNILATLQTQGQSFLAGMKLSMVDDQIYFTITDVPAIPFVELSAATANWYNYGNASVVKRLTEKAKQIRDLLAGNIYISGLQRLPDEQIAGQLVYHLRGALNLQAVRTALQVIGTPKTMQELFTDQTLGTVPVELWVGKHDYRLVQLTIDHADQAPRFLLSLNLSDFEQPVAIEKPNVPTPAVDFSQTLFSKTNFLDLPHFANLFGFSTEPFLVDADNDGLYVVWERFFGTDPEKADSDGDGFTDYQEIKNGYNPRGTGRLLE